MSEIDELKNLLKENLEISKKIYKNTEKIKRHFFWAKIWKSVKFSVIIILILAGVFYSRPYIEQIIGLYKNIYQTNFNNFDPAVIKQLQEILKK